MTPAPKSVVQGHIEAYDDGDFEAFLESFTADATVRALDGSAVHCEGREAIRREYAPIFEADAPLHCEVIEEIALGPYVALVEHVDGPAGETTALAVYRVEDGRIADLQLGYAD